MSTFCSRLSATLVLALTVLTIAPLISAPVPPPGNEPQNRTASAGGPAFRIVALETDNLLAVSHQGSIPDDRGGIAVSSSRVFYTGDLLGEGSPVPGTVGFRVDDLSDEQLAPTGYDALVSDLQTETVYSLGRGTNQIQFTNSILNFSLVDSLHIIDGETGALTGARVNLSNPIGIEAGQTGIFAGYGRIVILNRTNAYNIELPAGTVTDLGPVGFLGHSLTESWAYWGIAEHFQGETYVVYVRDALAIVRTRLSDRATFPVLTTQTFPGFGDIASISFSLSQSRWYFEQETDTFLLPFFGETVGSATGSFTLADGFPFITSAPTDRVAFPGGPAEFSVTATGSGPLQYQWLFFDLPIPGATGATLTLTNITEADQGFYSVQVSNVHGSLNSVTASLTVLSNPEFILEPQGQVAFSGTNITFTAGVLGAPPLSYQWRKDGVAIPGATNVNLTLSNIQPQDEADYVLSVTNLYGSILSQPARLTVLVDDGSVFRIANLGANDCLVVDHNNLTGDDRGGIGATSTHVFYTGDSSTARFQLADLGNGTALGEVYDSIVSNLRTETAYLLGNGDSALVNGGGIVTTLIELNNLGIRTGNQIALSDPIDLTVGFNVGLFSGWGRIVIHSGQNVYSIALPSGRVTDLGFMGGIQHVFTENWAYWGVAEHFGGFTYLAYVRDFGTTIVRSRVPDNQTSILATFNNLSDMAVFTVSVPRQRWYYHYEGNGQFGGSAETIGYCAASFEINSGSSPDRLVWDPIPQLQQVSQPFTVTVRAVTTSGMPATNFNGTASFSGVSNTPGTPVPILPIVGAQFTNGVWSGRATVLQSSLGMRLLAQDVNGIQGLSGEFLVSPPNDLAVLLTASPNPVANNQTLTYSILVTNLGPTTATGITLTNTLPTSAVVQSVTTSQGSCTTPNGLVVCTLGDLGPAGITLQIEVIIPTTGIATNHVSVTRQETDALPGNNSATQITTVTLPSLRITDAVGIEGNSGTNVLTFNISLTPPSTNQIQVRYLTANGTARSTGSARDFNALDRIAIFPPMTTNQTVEVEVTGDTLFEADENFQVILSSAIGATIADSSGQGTIRNDDIAPTINLTSVELVETDTTTNMVFAYSLSEPTGLGFFATYATADITATAGSDYLMATGTVVFSAIPIVRTQFISVTLLGDNLPETDETLALLMFDASSNLLASATGTILNDEGAGIFERLNFNPIASPQTPGVPFPVTITAVDFFDNPMTSFTDTVALSGRMGEPPIPGRLLEETPHDSFQPEGDFTIGMMFTPTSDIRVTHYRHYAGTRVSIWTDSGQLVHSQLVSSTPGTWIETAVTTPFTLSAGTTYRIGYYGGGQPYYWLNRNLTTFDHGIINDAVFATGDSFPGLPNGGGIVFMVNFAYEAGAPSTPFAVTPPVSGSFIDGVWTGDVTISETISNVTVQAVASNGTRGESSRFDVRQIVESDLELSLTSQPNPVLVGDTVSLQFTVLNHGPLSASSVALTNFLPASFTLVSAIASQGSCTNTGTTILCTLGDLALGNSATITITTQPTQEGDFGNVASIGHAGPDPAPANNSILTAINVTHPFPVIVTHPLDTSTTSGATVSFTVTAAGLPPFSYVWFHGSTPIPNSNTPTLTLPNVSLTDAGTYTVEVSNAAGSATSDPATLSIDQGLTFQIVSLDTTGVQTVDQGSVVGNDRGGIALSSSHVFVTGNGIGAAPLLVQPSVMPAATGDPDDQISEARPISIGAAIIDSIGDANDVDMYRIQAGAGQTIGFDVDHTAGGGFDSWLRLFDSSGNQLAACDDCQGPPPEFSGVEAFIQFTFSTGGTYYIGVSGFANGSYNPNTGTGDSGGSTGGYTLNVFADQPGSGRFTIDSLGAGTPLGTLYDALVSDLRTETVYSLGNGAGLIQHTNGLSFNSVNSLHHINGQTGQLTGTRVNLSSPVPIADGTTIFAGYGRIVILTAGSVHHISLPSGQVSNLGTLPGLEVQRSANWASWGIAEFFNNSVHLVYVQSPSTIARTRVDDGSTTSLLTVAPFPGLGDMASISFSLSRSRWYFHHEEDSIFASFGETLGSAKASFTLEPTHPFITTHPVDIVGVAEGTASFTVAATGGLPLFHQWFHDGFPLAGATSDTLTITDIAPEDAGLYWVEVSNDAGFVTSTPALLTVVAGPEILLQPAPQTVFEGTNVSFTVTVTGALPLEFQWNFDGIPIPDATNQVLSLPSVTSADEGNYSVTVRNRFGTAGSDNAYLSVLFDDGSIFRITSLGTNNCLVVDHDNITSDDRGGIAVSATHVLVTGDGGTGSFTIGNLGSGFEVSTTPLDSLISNLRTEKMYVLGTSTGPAGFGGGIVTRLIELTDDGRITQNHITLSTPIAVSQTVDQVGIFSGYGRVVIHTGINVYSIRLPSGTVSDLGPMSPLGSHRSSESWAYWGVAEHFGGQTYLAHVNNSSQIVRARVPDGEITVINQFTSLSDMASITVSVSQGRWYFHHEGSSQFTNNGSEILGSCAASFEVDLGSAPDHFQWGPLPNFQSVGTPFDALITARNTQGEIITNFNGTATLAGLDPLTGLPVTIAPTTAIAFTNGIWAGQVTVPTAAPQMVLIASDTAGTSGLSSPFAVTPPNDLILIVEESADPTLVGLPLTYFLTVTNTGPLDATGVALSHLLPPTVTFNSVTTTVGTCTHASGTVSCNLGTVSQDQTVRIAVTVAAPTVPGFLTNSIQVTRSEVDPLPSNNSATELTLINFPVVSINDVTVTEGNTGTTNAVFTLTLSTPSTNSVSVGFTTANGTARSTGNPSDFTATSGRVSFEPGETTAFLTVVVNGDTLFEADEFLRVQLFSPLGAGILDNEGIGNILNDDAAPTISIADVSITEGNRDSTNATLEVVLSETVGLGIQLDYATADLTATSPSDYAAVTGSLIFIPNTRFRTQYVSVPIIGDTLIESNETFFLTVTSITNASVITNRAAITILDDDGQGFLRQFSFSPIASPQFPLEAFTTTIQAEDFEGTHLPAFNGTLSLSAAIGEGTTSSIVISELEPGTPDSVEFSNVGNNQVDMSGWTASIYESSFGDPTSAYIFPPGSIIPAGASFMLLEFGSSPGSFPQFFLGANINWTHSSGASIGVVLQDSSGTLIDVVVAAALQASSISFPTTIPPEHWDGPPLPANTADTTTFQRIGDQDHNAATDWQNGPDSPGTQNTGLTIPFTGGRTPVGVAPTSVTLTNGTWSGEITLLENATNVVLIADDGAGHRGESNPFDAFRQIAPDIQVLMTASTPAVELGNSISYSIVVTNAGLFTASSVVLTNPLPAGVTVESFSTSRGLATVEPGMFAVRIGPIFINTAVTVSLVLTPNTAGPFTNTAAAYATTPGTMQTTLAPFGSIWSYRDDNIDQGVDWRQPAFNDSTWASGPAPIGFGEDYILTTVNGGPANNRTPTLYFRLPFTVSSIADLTSLAVHFIRDDGLVVYLNGMEAFRNNMPPGIINHTTLAASSPTETTPPTIITEPVPTALLTPGTNWLAVEVHQVANDSSDLVLDLQIVESRLSAVPGDDLNFDNNARSLVVNVTNDSDEDGIPNDWELLHGLDPNDPGDAGLDADFDMASNLEEYQSQTDPNDPASVMIITGIQVVGADVRIGFRGSANVTYRLERRDSVNDWRTILVFRVGSLRSISVIDTGGASLDMGLYRISRF